MTIDDIAKYRLINQQLRATQLTTHHEVVSCLGAMQAQDYAMAKWAIGIRQPTTTDNAIEQAINNGNIIRTHILRPTWHFVAAEDIRWMLALTSPHVKTINNSACKRLDLDKDILVRCNNIIEKLLRDNKQLTRPEIMAELSKKKIPTNDIRAALIMMNAELEGLVCNGIIRDKQFTYALLDERIKPTRPFTKEEALAALAKRYFNSHGPATLQDFIWWSGLSISHAKLALELIKSILSSLQIDEQIYWFNDSIPYQNTESTHFLPAFDELIISYKNRTAVIPLEHQSKAFTNNGIFKPTILSNGKVIGTWKRSFKKDAVIMELSYFNSIKKTERQIIADTAKQYGNFLDMETIIR
jgi:hypothetical protein